MSLSPEAVDMKTALMGLFSAYKEHVETDISETRLPLCIIAFDYPEYRTGVTYHLFGSFSENGELSKPRILTVISADAHATIVAEAESVSYIQIN